MSKVKIMFPGYTLADLERAAENPTGRNSPEQIALLRRAIAQRKGKGNTKYAFARNVAFPVAEG
jgi:hypothetical protein